MRPWVTCKQTRECNKGPALVVSAGLGFQDARAGRRRASPAGRASPARRSPRAITACPARCRSVGVSLPSRARRAISTSWYSRAIRSLASQSWSSASAWRIVGLLPVELFENDADAVSVGVLDVEDRPMRTRRDGLLDIRDLLAGQARDSRQREPAERDRHAEV